MNDPSPKAAPHPGINRTRRPLVHYAEKTGSLDQLYWDRLAGKTPCQKRTTASTVNGHNSLIVELRLHVTTCVDHSGITASSQIGIQRPLYSNSGQQCGTLAPAGGQYPLKPLGDTSPAWPCHPSHKACSTKHTQSDHVGRLTVDLPNAV